MSILTLIQAIPKGSFVLKIRLNVMLQPGFLNVVYDKGRQFSFEICKVVKLVSLRHL